MKKNFSEKLQKDFNEWEFKQNYLIGLDKPTRKFIRTLMELAFFEGAKLTLRKLEKKKCLKAN